MIPYFIVFLLLMLPLKKKYINNWCFFILLIFTILRWDVGWDYRVYYKLAENINLNQIPLFINNQDIFMYLSKSGSWNYIQ